MLLGIILGDPLPCFSDESLHDVLIIDDGVGLTITVQHTDKPDRDVKFWRADQILTGGFRMKGDPKISEDLWEEE